jgi:protein-disulfide isomerase
MTLALPALALALAAAQAPVPRAEPAAPPSSPPAPAPRPASSAGPAADLPAAAGADAARATATGAEGLDWSRVPASVGADALTPAQRAVLAQVLERSYCYCGCPHSLLGCLTTHPACEHAPRMGALAARLAGLGLPPGDVEKALVDYYASFDRVKRANLDVSGFGPPLGEPAAPITLIVFSDFQCPFCQQFRPRLEALVERHKGRVKLYAKPFPLATHPRALAAAEAAEWARAQGIFWEFHDAMFENPKALDDDALAALATRLGKDGDDLRAALQEQRFREKVQFAQSEARRAGLLGTPTLYVNGRRHVIPDFSDTILDFTLDDEEEWAKARGWGD